MKLNRSSAMSQRYSSTLLALCSAVALFGGAAPAAASDYYKVEPAAAPAAGRIVVRDLLWKCGPDGCVAGKSGGRVTVDCAALVRKIGAVKSFSVAGRALGAAELEKCNARAK
jgi:hypothetical protein